MKLSKIIEQLKWPIILLSVFILLHIPIEQLITSTVIENLAKHVESVLINDLIILFLCSLFLIYQFSKISKPVLVSRRLLQLVVVVTLAYSWYRFGNQKIWIITPFYLFSDVRYMDCLYLYILVLGISVLFRNYWSAKSSSLSYCGKLIEDVPLTVSSADHLNREHYARELALKINATRFSSAYAIGINGPWGTGKTSFMTLVKRNLELDNRIIFDFNPWSSHDDKSIIRNFFKSMQSALTPYHHSIGHVVLAYANNLVDAYGDSFFKITNPFAVNNKSLEEQQDYINKLLGRIDKQLVVFVDDLDRLDKDELFEVMKLIRNTANFRNVVFIVAYDRNYVLNALSNINSANSEFYLEKIFQMEVLLPHFDQQILKLQLVDKMKMSLISSWHQEIEDLVLGRNTMIKVFVEHYILTMRDVVRFANSFSLHLGKLRGEVLVDELFNLELLRFKFPAVYELLYKRKDNILEAHQKNMNNYEYGFKIDEQRKTILRSYLADNAVDLSITPKQISSIVLLLEYVFPQGYSPKRTGDHLSVKHPSNFDRYFAIRLSDSDMSEVDFSNARRKSQDGFNKFIQETVEKGLHHLLRNRFKEIRSYDDKTDFERIIGGLFYLMRCSVNRGWIGFSNQYAAEDLVNKLYKPENIAKKFYNGSIEGLTKFISDQFHYGVYPNLLEMEFINSIKLSTFDDDNVLLSIADLEAMNLGYLKAIAGQEHALLPVVWEAFHHCYFKYYLKVNGGYQNNYEYIPGSTKILIDFIKNNNIEEFLEIIVTRNHRSNMHFSLWGDIPLIFGSWGQFREWLDEVSDKNNLSIHEFSRFYDMFADRDFKEYVEFEFINLKPYGLK